MKTKSQSLAEIRDRFKEIRADYCEACGKTPCDVAHIRSRGAGGGNQKWNLMPLCRSCHATQHNLGWKKFSDRHFRVFAYLMNSGWEFDDMNKLIRSRRQIPLS